MVRFFAKQLLYIFAKHILLSLHKEKSGFFMLRNNYVLCCYDIRDEQSWSSISELRKKMINETDNS